MGNNVIDPWRLLWDLAWQLWIAQLIILIVVYIALATLALAIILYLLARKGRMGIWRL